MANTDDTQNNLTSNKNPKGNVGVKVTRKMANNSDSTKGKDSLVGTPLMRYFDLAEESNCSYVLGYN
ncbi:hypothetical protein [Colwellia piezophila]|uniref:hypothetical protein n=1 Tax=Colwellia piezophila TaxID=211668 RepID=UPI00036B87CC|nr:hypothetical protein [Colwellia piezophila]